MCDQHHILVEELRSQDYWKYGENDGKWGAELTLWKYLLRFFKRKLYYVENGLVFYRCTSHYTQITVTNWGCITSCWNSSVSVHVETECLLRHFNHLWMKIFTIFNEHSAPTSFLLLLLYVMSGSWAAATRLPACAAASRPTELSE